MSSGILLSKRLFTMEKQKILLEWDDKKGHFRKYLIIEACQQNNEEETQFVKVAYVGTM